MMNTFLLCLSLAPLCKPLNLNHEAAQGCLEARETLEDDDRRYVAAKLVNIAQRSIGLTMRHSAKAGRRPTGERPRRGECWIWGLQFQRRMSQHARRGVLGS